MEVLDTLSRDAVRKPLCQRCYNPLILVDKSEEVEVEPVCAMVESAMLGCGPSFQETRESKNHSMEIFTATAWMKKNIW